MRGVRGLGLTTARGGASDEQAVVGATIVSEDCWWWGTSCGSWFWKQ